MLSKEVSRRLHDVFAAHPAVRAAYVFGSTATDTDQSESDVDIGIVVDSEHWKPSDKIELLGDCVEAGEEQIDLIVLNDAPLVVQFEVVRPNMLLYAAEDFHHGRFFSKIVRMYWDFEPYLRRQRDAFKERLVGDTNHG